jgi:hypothetical protein
MEFEGLLRRLTDRRGWKAGAVARDVGGDVATPGALRRLAPVLGGRAADLFVLAGHDLPADLAPTDPAADPAESSGTMSLCRRPARSCSLRPGT